MDLKRLPPSMLVVLGLACARSQPPTVGPCLSPPYDPSADEVGPCLSPPVEDSGDSGTTGEPGETDTGDEPPVGPCLSPPAPPSSATEASASTTLAHEPADALAASRGEAIERLLARATLPADVAERLRRHTDGE